MPDRLRSGRDISRTLRQGRRHACHRVVVHVRRSGDGSTPARLTVVASRRVGNAVQRNRAKRLLREAARLLQWRAGHDVVLVARAATTTSGLAAVGDDVARAAAALDAFEPAAAKVSP
ncbi:MAG: ribonuclease P protein component [Nitriliruptoraceae bacterium]|nr:ribonuclease P protein component [Nitriliruptoraceae bacterium]